MLHELVARHAQTMLAELRDADPEGAGLPRYVERELAAYLKCGILAHGFSRVRCRACGDEIVVASNVGGRSTFRNAGGTRREGVELQAERNWGAIALFASFSEIRATYRDVFAGTRDD